MDVGRAGRRMGWLGVGRWALGVGIGWSYPGFEMRGGCGLTRQTIREGEGSARADFCSADFGAVWDSLCWVWACFVGSGPALLDEPAGSLRRDRFYSGSRWGLRYRRPPSWYAASKAFSTERLSGVSAIFLTREPRPRSTCRQGKLAPDRAECAERLGCSRYREICHDDGFDVPPRPKSWNKYPPHTAA